MRSLITVKSTHWFPALLVLITLLMISCQTSPAAIPIQPGTVPAEATTSKAAAIPSVSTPNLAAGSAAATAAPTPTLGAVESARDTVILVTSSEPDQLGAWSAGCSGNVPSLVCEDLTSDPLTWIDSATFEVAPLTGVERWEMIEPNRWRFFLRDGVKFHNGEPWNAAAAKMGIDFHGDRESAGNGTGSYGFHGVISGQVVGDLTVDVVCGVNCPIFPRTAMFLKFQAPEWYSNASDDQRDNLTIGTGPYRMVEWRRGVEVELERYEDYLPNTAFDAQGPSIDRVFQVWLNEELARAAMIAAGEADLAFDIGFDNIDQVPKALTGTNNEVYILVADNIWHPELKKRKVREALVLAIDCETIMETLFNGLQECWGNISQFGTVGINELNSAPYDYDPVRARELLAEAGYDPANEIRIHSRRGRVFRDVELWESVIRMWNEVGVNGKLQILEPGLARDTRRSGCGGTEDPDRCEEFGPPPPTGASSHYYETATSNESLDLQRQLLLRNSCGNVNSRVCNQIPGFQEGLQDAIATEQGPDRTAKLESLAQTIRDEFWFIPMFQVVTVYGLAEDLEWTPRYDPRTRVNTMRFTR